LLHLYNLLKKIAQFRYNIRYWIYLLITLLGEVFFIYYQSLVFSGRIPKKRAFFLALKGRNISAQGKALRKYKKEF